MKPGNRLINRNGANSHKVKLTLKDERGYVLLSLFWIR